MVFDSPLPGSIRRNGQRRTDSGYDLGEHVVTTVQSTLLFMTCVSSSPKNLN